MKPNAAPIILFALLVPLTSAEEVSFEAQSGDPEKVLEIARQTASTTAWPRPSFAAYGQDVGQTVAAFVEGWLYRFGATVNLAGLIVKVGAGLLIATTLGLVVLLLLRFRRHWQRSQAASQATHFSLGDDAETAQPSAESWQNLLDQQLAANDPNAALESLWWWLASRLIPEHADPSWTSRELIHHGQRADLLPEVRRFDALLYGAAAPSVERVRSLWHDLRARVA